MRKFFIIALFFLFQACTLFSEISISFGAGFLMSSYDIYHFKNLPDNIRSIPLHVEDSYLKNYSHATEPLPSNFEINLGSTWYLNIYSTLNIHIFKYLCVYCGVHSKLRLNNYWGSDSKLRFQQNQFGGNDRGEKMSLRYYEFQDHPPPYTFLIGLSIPFKNIIKTYSENDPVILVTHLIFDYDIIGTSLIFESGWDRWNQDEPWKHVNLGRLHTHRIMLGCSLMGKFNPEKNNLNGVGTYIGYEYYNFSRNDLHEYFSFEKGQFFISINYEINLIIL